MPASFNALRQARVLALTMGLPRYANSNLPEASCRIVRESILAFKRARLAGFAGRDNGSLYCSGRVWVTNYSAGFIDGYGNPVDSEERFRDSGHFFRLTRHIESSAQAIRNWNELNDIDIRRV